jgi:multiple sugar transport system permease protein
MLSNTLIIAIMSVIGTVLSSSLVAYGFARVKWPGRDWVFGLVLATMMLPGAVTMMPQFLIFRQLHWIDTLFPLWVPSFFASAFNVFFLRQFFLGIPAELEDAARIDGCGYFRTWWNVMLPLVKPALAAVAITTFLGSWKDFMGPLIYISSPEKLTLAYGLQLYNSSHGGEPGYLMAATTMVIVPVMLLFFFTQRYFTQGIALSGFGGR